MGITWNISEKCKSKLEQAENHVLEEEPSESWRYQYVNFFFSFSGVRLSSIANVICTYFSHTQT